MENALAVAKYMKPAEQHMASVSKEDHEVDIMNAADNLTNGEFMVYQRPKSRNSKDLYCVVFRSDDYVINQATMHYNPVKRFFINECIRQMYIMYNLWAPPNTVYDHREMRRQLDYYLRPSQLTRHQELAQRVKRKLFREPQTKRKQLHPTNSKQWTTIYFHRPVRQQITVRRLKVRRGYQNCARKIVIDAIIAENARVSEFQSHFHSLVHVCPNFSLFSRYLPTCMNFGIYDVNAKLMSNISNYHANNAPHQSLVEAKMTVNEAERRYFVSCRLIERVKQLETMFVHEQIRQFLQTHQFIFEEARRSTYYGQQLFRLVEDHNKFLYQDNHILRRA